MKNTYTYVSGETVEVPEIAVPEKKSLMFKVNVPSTKEDEEKGVGEGMWACTTEGGFRAWDEDAEGIHFVHLLNDSVYYPPMKWGTVIPVRFVAGKRPVALYEELQHHFGSSKKEDVIRFLLPKAEKKL